MSVNSLNILLTAGYTWNFFLNLKMFTLLDHFLKLVCLEMKSLMQYTMSLLECEMFYYMYDVSALCSYHIILTGDTCIKEHGCLRAGTNQ